MTSTKAHAIRSRSLKTSIGGVAILATTALVLSGCATTDEGTTPAGDLTLKIGTALPQTGNLAFLGPPEEAGVAYAASEVEAYAETTGLSLEIVYGDSGDTDNKAYERRSHPVLAGQHVGRVLDLRRQRPVLPYGSVGRSPG